MRAKRTRRPFTLTQLLVLAAVAAILTALALPAYSVRTAKGKAGILHATNPKPMAVTIYDTKKDGDVMALDAVYPLVHTPAQYAAVSIDETGAIAARLGSRIEAAQTPDKTALGASLRLQGRHVQYLYEVLF